MAWTVEDVEKYCRGLTAAQKNRWVKIANDSYSRCCDEGERTSLDCEVSAVKVANAKFADKDYSLGEGTCPVFPEIQKVYMQEIVLKEAAVSDEYQMVLPVGLFHSKWYGEVIITEGYVQAMVDNWKKKVLKEQEPFVDTEHDRSRANGWIEDLKADRNGLYAKIKWTEMGRQNVGQELFKYFSADIDMVIDVESGEVVYPVLVAVALCNTPVMKTLKKAHLSDKGAATGHQEPPGGNYGGVADPIKSAIMKLIKKPAHSDGIKRSAHSDGLDKLLQEFSTMELEKILEAINSLSAEDKMAVAIMLSDALKPSKNGEDGKGTDGDGKQLDEGNQKAAAAAAGSASGTGDIRDYLPSQGATGNESPAIKALTAQFADLQEKMKVVLSGKMEKETSPEIQDPAVAAQISVLQKANEQMTMQLSLIQKKELDVRREKVISMALKEGRIYPKDKEWWEKRFNENPDSVQEVIAKMTPSKIFTEEGTGSDGNTFVLNESPLEKQYREAMGISAEDAAKYGQVVQH